MGGKGLNMESTAFVGEYHTPPIARASASSSCIHVLGNPANNGVGVVVGGWINVHG